MYQQIMSSYLTLSDAGDGEEVGVLFSHSLLFFAKIHFSK